MAQAPWKDGLGELVAVVLAAALVAAAATVLFKDPIRSFFGEQPPARAARVARPAPPAR